MKKINQLDRNLLVVKSEKAIPVTRKMVRERAVELAVSHGRSSMAASSADWEQAKKELTAVPENLSKDTVLEPGNESPQWAPVLGSLGRTPQVPEGDDEDEEGKSNADRMVEKGILKAEKDQIHQAERIEGEKRR